jgi:DNA-binding transcriptional ArsR family regulator
MGNELIFKALSCPTRIKILQIITSKEIHLSGIAKEIGISKPVVSKHIKILEDAGFINKKIIGNIHLFSIKTNIIERLVEPFYEESTIELNKNMSLSDVLKQIPNIEIKKVGKHQYIKSINSENGYFIYEVNGKLPDKPINEYNIKKNLSLDLKKLISVKKKKINIIIKEDKK